MSKKNSNNESSGGVKKELAILAFFVGILGVSILCELIFY